MILSAEIEFFPTNPGHQSGIKGKPWLKKPALDECVMPLRRGRCTSCIYMKKCQRPQSLGDGTNARVRAIPRASIDELKALPGACMVESNFYRFELNSKINS